MNQKIINGLKIFIVFFIPLSIFYYLFEQISFNSILQQILKSNIVILFFSLILSFTNNILLTSFRWKKILETIGYAIPYREVLLVKMGAEPFVGLLPMKTGEASRAIYLNKFQNVNFNDAIFSIFIGYIINFVILISYAILGLFLFLYHPINISKNYTMFFPAICFLDRGVVHKFKTWINKKIKFKRHLKNIKRVGFNREILSISIIIWFVEIFNVYWLSIALGQEIPLPCFMMFIPIIIITSHLPITIAGAGVREGLILLFFYHYAPPEHLLALGLLYSFVENFFPIMIGGLASGYFTKKILLQNPQNQVHRSTINKG